MYQPRYFKQQDKKQLLELIENNALATIVSLSSQGLLGNHIPMIMLERDGQLWLQGHVAKANNIWQDYDDKIDILAIFHGVNAYISPNWYPSKKISDKEVPTWNYEAVHVNGIMRFYQDKTWLYKHLDQLSQINEKKVVQTWRITDAPKDYINKMFNAIVGLEIEVKQISGQSKMSQNHPTENRLGVINGLNNLGKDDVAKCVEKASSDTSS
jgi:transcriptional regulator